jgi:subtilisin family serine protease
LRQRDAERLEDRLQHVLRVTPLDQADVKRQAGALGELGQKPGDEVGREPADAHVGEIDVGHEQRPPGGLEGDMGERLVRRHDGGAVAARVAVVQGSRERLTERPAGGRDLGVRLLGGDLERDVERRMLGEECQEVVEDRNAGVDRCFAGAVDLDPRLQPAFLARVPGHSHPSKQGIAAPSAHRYGSWRFLRTVCGQMRPPLPKLSRLVAFAALAAALVLVLGGTAAASVRSSQGVAGVATVVGYSSDRGLRRAAALSGSRIVRRIPALHAAVLRTPPAAVRLLDGLRGIRYSDQPVLRHQLVDPALTPAPAPGGAYEWQYAATRENVVPASVQQAAAAITVAVLDTGADVSAPDLAAKTPATWSVRSNSPNVTDNQGHGTFVSSLAAGSTTNAEGIAGFGGDAKLLAVQAAAADGSITDVDEAAAIVYAVDHGAKIINMSFGGPTTSTTEQSAIAYATARGVLLVAAAGNSGQTGNEPNYPAALLQPLGSNGQGGVGLAVAASTLAGGRASFSNYGSYISLAAPGENVFGALSSSSDPGHWPRQSLPGSVSGLYGYGSGTSFSSPEVAGAAALVWAANPQLTAAQVAEIIKESASGQGGWNQETGYGLLDVAAAVARARGTSITMPTVALGGTRFGRRVALSWGWPGAVSFSLSVSRDGGAPQTLLASTTATGSSYQLEPGHSYSFTVKASDAYGVTHRRRLTWSCCPTRQSSSAYAHRRLSAASS